MDNMAITIKGMVIIKIFVVVIMANEAIIVVEEEETRITTSLNANCVKKYGHVLKLLLQV